MECFKDRIKINLHQFNPPYDPRKFQRILRWLEEEMIIDLFHITDDEIQQLVNKFQQRLPRIQRQRRPPIERFIQQSPVDQKLMFLIHCLQIIQVERELFTRHQQLFERFPNITSSMLVSTMKSWAPNMMTRYSFLNKFFNHYQRFFTSPTLPHLHISSQTPILKVLNMAKINTIYFSIIVDMFNRLFGKR